MQTPKSGNSSVTSSLASLSIGSNGDGRPQHCGSHIHESFEVLNQIRESRLFCDVTIIVDNFEIPAHKNVLASSSRYFFAMFTDNFQENDDNKIAIRGMSYTTFNTIIKYIYSETISISDDNVQDLLTAADMLLLLMLKDDCCRYLYQRIRADNCLGIRNLALTFKHPKLTNAVETFINSNFPEILGNEEMLKLSYEDVKELLTRDIVAYTSPQKIFESMMAWLKYDLKDRKKYLSNLITCVQLTQIPKDYMRDNVITEPILMGDLKCNRLIIDALIQNNAPIPVKKQPPKKRLGARNVLLIIGGKGEAGKTFEFYNFTKERDVQLYQLPMCVCSTGMANVNETVYVVGGQEHGHPVGTVWKYDLNLGNWSESVKMIRERSSHCVAVLNGCIYAIGGYDNRQYLKSVERFDPSSELWLEVAPMSMERHGMGIAVLNNQIYVVGGFDAFGVRLKSVERYDPHTDSWSVVSDMKIPRVAPGVAVVGTTMYVVGGYYYQTLKTMEAYNPLEDKWQEMPSMNVARHGVSLVEANGFLYAIGGTSDGGSTDYSSLVEMYDPQKKNKWTMLSNRMNVGRAYHCAIHC